MRFNVNYLTRDIDLSLHDFIRSSFFTVRAILLVMLVGFLLKFLNITINLEYTIALIALLRSYELEFHYEKNSLI